MSTEAALLAAVAAAPEDSLPRLVYADWLDEQGDPRAEMVRVMEELRKHPVWADEYQRLRPARSRLWASLDPAWLETMGYQRVYRPLFGTMPEKREHRWRLAEEFIDIWHGGLKEGDGFTDAAINIGAERISVPIPTALREWYHLGGKRHDIWSNRQGPHSPRQLFQRDNDDVVIRSEHPVCRCWLIRGSDLQQPDPPVHSDLPPDYDSRSGAESVSAFALMVLIFEVQVRNIGCVIRTQPDEQFTLSQRFQRAALPGREHHTYTAQFWEADDTVLNFDGDVWVATCRTETAYQQLVHDFGERVIRV